MFVQIDHREPWAHTHHTRSDELDHLCPHDHQPQNPRRLVTRRRNRPARLRRTERPPPPPQQTPAVRRYESAATTATASRMPATSCSPRSSASAASPSSTGSGSSSTTRLGRQRFGGLEREAVHQHRVRLGASRHPRTAPAAIASERAGVVAPATTNASASIAASAHTSCRRRDQLVVGRARGPLRQMAARARVSPNERVRERRGPAPARARRRTGPRPGRAAGRAGPCRRHGCAPTIPGRACSRASPRTTARARARGGRRVALPDQLGDAVDTRGRRRAQRGEHFEHAVVGNARDELGRVEVGLGAQPGERVPHVGRERIGLERGEHLGRRGLDRTVEIHHVGAARYAPRSPTPGTRRRSDRSTPASRVRAASTSPSCRCAAASRRSPRSGRGAFSRTTSAQTLDLPRPAARQEDAGDERGGRAADRGIGGFRGDLEPVERLFLPQTGEERARAVERLVARRRDVVGGDMCSRSARPNRLKAPVESDSRRAHGALQRTDATREREQQRNLTAQVRTPAADLVLVHHGRSRDASPPRARTVAQQKVSSCSTSRCKRSRPRSTVSPRANASPRRTSRTPRRRATPRRPSASRTASAPRSRAAIPTSDADHDRRHRRPAEHQRQQRLRRHRDDLDDRHGPEVPARDAGDEQQVPHPPRLDAAGPLMSSCSPRSTSRRRRSRRTASG